MSDEQVERPDFVQDEHLIFLDNLKELGAVDMFGACPYLLIKFPDLTADDARDTLVYWMRTFSEHHPE